MKIMHLARTGPEFRSAIKIDGQWFSQTSRKSQEDADAKVRADALRTKGVAVD